jgi:hypothetical protein
LRFLCQESESLRKRYKKKEEDMKAILLRTVLALVFVLIAGGLFENLQADSFDVPVDGSVTSTEVADLPANTLPGPGGKTLDIVGEPINPTIGTGLAKGNSYRVDISVFLNEAEFWLSFTGTQTLTYYVYVSTVEFGTYTEVYRDTQIVTGSGAGWYSTGPLCVALNAGYHYIIAVSWDGTLTYYFGVGDSQNTSFGAYTHGYASGTDPLPPSIESLVNDYAIYHQRLTTGNEPSSVKKDTWGSIKSLYW